MTSYDAGISTQYSTLIQAIQRSPATTRLKDEAYRIARISYMSLYSNPAFDIEDVAHWIYFCLRLQALVETPFTYPQLRELIDEMN